MIDFAKDKYRKDDILPSELSLAKKYQCSRYDVRKVYLSFIENHEIYVVKGKGYFYSGQKNKIHLLLSGDKSFTEKMIEQKIPFQTVNQGVQKIKDPILYQQYLQISPETDVYSVKRLRLIDNEPAALHISYLGSDHFQNLEKDGHSIISMYRYFKENGHLNFMYENSLMELSILTSEESRLLGNYPTQPAFVLTAICREESGKILEYCRIIYRADLFKFLL